MTMLLTEAKEGSAAERFEMEQFLFLLDDVLRQFAPDVLVTYGRHAVVQEAMRRARKLRIATVFTLRNHGYADRQVLRARRSRVHVQPLPERGVSPADRSSERGPRVSDRLGGSRGAPTTCAGS